MTAEQRCEVTDLIVTDCAHCRSHPTAGLAFRAAYPDECATCSNPIEVGQRIRETPLGGYEHAGHR